MSRSYRCTCLALQKIVPSFTENQSRHGDSSHKIAPITTTLNPSPNFGWRYKLLLGSAIFLLLGFAGYKYWTSKQPYTLMGHGGEVNAVAISPDGRTISVVAMTRR